MSHQESETENGTSIEAQSTSESASPEPSLEPSVEKAASAQTVDLKYTNRLTLAGLLLSAVLVWIHVQTHLFPATDAFCTVGEKFDCNLVAASPHSVVFGLPWAVWGTLGYVAMFTASLTRSLWLLPLCLFSALISAALLLVSLLSVGSLCYLCEGVHVVSFALAFLVYRGRRKLTGDLKDPSMALTVLGAPLGLAVSLLIFLPRYWDSFSYKGEPPFPTGMTEEGFPWIGSESPKTTIEEYVDYQCPHCKIGAAQTLRVLGKHSDWRVVRRHQPRMRCDARVPSTCKPARLAYCAGTLGQFWRGDRWLFAHSDDLKEPDVSAMALDLGLDPGALRTCYESPQAYEFARSENKAANKRGARAVPVYFVDGKRLKGEELENFFK